MSSRFDGQRPTALEEQAYIEAKQRFADDLEQSPVNRDALDRLERSLAVMTLAANMAVSKPAENMIQADDGTKWYKGVDLLDNIYFCHRPITSGVEYAVIEYSPTRETNEIWNQGWNASDVLQVFVQEQRQAMKIWMDDMTARVKGFLMVRYPGQEIDRLAEDFMHQFLHMPQQPTFHVDL